MPLEFAAWCKYIPRADPEMDPTSIRASRELYFSARTTSPLRLLLLDPLQLLLVPLVRKHPLQCAAVYGVMTCF